MIGFGSLLLVVALVVIYLVLDIFTTPLTALAVVLFVALFVVTREISLSVSGKLNQLCDALTYDERCDRSRFSTGWLLWQTMLVLCPYYPCCFIVSLIPLYSFYMWLVLGGAMLLIEVVMLFAVSMMWKNFGRSLLLLWGAHLLVYILFTGSGQLIARLVLQPMMV